MLPILVMKLISVVMLVALVEGRAFGKSTKKPESFHLLIIYLLIDLPKFIKELVQLVLPLRIGHLETLLNYTFAQRSSALK